MSTILKFIKPEKIIIHKANEFAASFEFKPLEPGFGITIGNSLRRVLLNSLEGYAISAIKINKINHEFSSIKGVLEDVPEIILNLKQIRFKLNAQDAISQPQKIEINLKGKTVFTAGMIQDYTAEFSVTNPDLVICNMDASANLLIELTITRGRGYILAEDHNLKDLTTDHIAIDSIYTPIKNVKYAIENTRVEQRTDFEKLLIDIQTDGTIHPELALKEAAKILIHHLMVISDENLTFEVKEEKTLPVIDDKQMQVKKVLKTPLEDLDLSVRAFNCLKAARINSLIELVQYRSEDLMKFRNFGQKSLTEIEQVLNERGLHFGMDLSKMQMDRED